MRLSRWLHDVLKSSFKTPELARYGVINRFKMLIYAHVNYALFRTSCPTPPTGPALLFKIAPGDFVSPIYALPRTHLRNFKTAFNVSFSGS